MMHVLMISTDIKMFEQESSVRTRMIEYGSLCDELHIIVFTKKEASFQKIMLSDRVYVYPTGSHSKYFYWFDALRIGFACINSKFFHSNITVITTQDPFETGVVGRILAKKYNIPLNVQIHTDFLSHYFRKENFLNRIRLIVARFVLRGATSVRVVSLRIKESLVSRRFVRAKCRIDVLPIFVDLQKIKETIPRRSLKTEYPQFNKILLMASRLTHEKDIQTALCAFKSVLVSEPRAGIVIVGAGPERDFIFRFSKENKIEASVVVLPWMSQEDIYAYYKTADVFLVSSLYEGYGMTIVEAGASGVAIVSTNVGIAPELLSESNLCSPRDSICLTTHIVDAFKHPQNYRVAKSYNPFLNRKEYLEKYRESLLV